MIDRIAIYLLAAGLGAGALLGFGAYKERAGKIAGRAEIQAKWDADKLARSTKALETIKEYRAREQALVDTMTKEVADAKAAADRARRDVAAGATERDGLRDYAAALAAACDRPAADPPAAGGSAPAASPGLVLADLRQRADDVAEELAIALDLAHAAGRACERIHDALIPVSAPRGDLPTMNPRGSP